MAMTEEKYTRLIQKLEEMSKRDAKGYRLRVGLFAALGYGYIFGIFLIVLSLFGAIIYFAINAHRMNFAIGKVLFILGALNLAILRAFWVRMEAPEGVPLTRAQVPALFTMLDGICQKLNAPLFHHVLLTDDFNAGVVQIPRLGVLGWQQNYLMLGLPLMQALSPDQFRGVLAHEVGHLSGNHSRFSGWIYRVRKTWAQLLDNLQTNQTWGSGIFLWFLRWYFPRFDAYTFVLARADEYQADRDAAEVAGPRAISEALVQIRLRGQALEEDFWPDLYKQAAHQPDPPVNLFTQMEQSLRRDLSSVHAVKWLTHALKVETDYDDTHPSLTDRLRALGHPEVKKRAEEVSPQALIPPPLTETAAMSYFGPALDHYTEVLNREWNRAVELRWKERYKEGQEELQELQTLNTRAEREPLTEEEEWERVRLTGSLQGDETATPLIHALLTRNPNHAKANFAWGMILLKREEAAGVPFVERAIEADEDLVLPGCQALFSFLKMQGQEEAAKQYEQRAIQRIERIIAEREATPP